jgi:hypothetical protein
MRALVSRGDIQLIRYLSTQRPSMASELSEATGLRRATVRLTESEVGAWCWLAKEFSVGKTPRTPPLI